MTKQYNTQNKVSTFSQMEILKSRQKKEKHLLRSSSVSQDAARRERTFSKLLFKDSAKL